MGTSGVCTTSLTFSVPKENYIPIVSKKAPEVTVTITYPNDSTVTVPRFWVDSRVIKNGAITFTCYDRMAFADGTYFTEKDVETIPESTTKLSVTSVMHMIANKMGIEYSKGISESCIRKIPVDTIPGSTCAQLLENISAVECGFFQITNENKLIFTRFGSMESIPIAVSDYTEPDIGDTLTVGEIVVTGDSGKVYTRTENADNMTINISGGSLVNNKTTTALYESIIGQTYTYGSIEKAVIEYIPLINSPFIHQNNSLLINNISISVSSAGMIASLSSNQAGGNEIGQYMGRITRELEKTIKSGSVIGNNFLVTKYQGIICIDSADLDDEEED